MKDLEKDNLNDFQEVSENEEIKTTDFSDEEIELQELNSEEENDLTGGGGSWDALYTPINITINTANFTNASEIKNELEGCFIEYSVKFPIKILGSNIASFKSKRFNDVKELTNPNIVKGILKSSLGKDIYFYISDSNSKLYKVNVSIINNNKSRDFSGFFNL